MAGEHVYATVRQRPAQPASPVWAQHADLLFDPHLLLNDSYVPGALVLAHSLRDAGTTKKLAVLPTLDSVSADAVTQLMAVYDYVLPVPRICNQHSTNLGPMNRPDLHSTLTKIDLWKQIQFSKIVYVDADVVAVRAPDELFALPHAFAAAPDTGWPDLFNTGVMLLTPNMSVFRTLLAMAERGVSFDGADQGLLNMHFGHDFHRLSFTYNVTPSVHYQYLPAYRHFQSNIRLVHFIGTNKPWLADRHIPRDSSNPYDEMVGRWWSVHDLHCGIQTDSETKASCPRQPQPPSPVSPATGGARPTSTEPPRDVHHAAIEPAENHRRPSISQDRALPSNTSAQSVTHGLHAEASPGPFGIAQEEQRTSSPDHATTPPPGDKNVAPPFPMMAWDASRQPPQDSKPEAINFPSAHYQMSRDTNPFVPPVRYPSPPKNMWYEVPEKTPAPATYKPPPIFPWEKKQPKPARSFVDQHPEVTSTTESATDDPPGKPESSTSPTPSTMPIIETCPKSSKGEPQTPTTPAIVATPSDSWTTFSRLNAWDEMPEITRYIEALQEHRHVKSPGAEPGTPEASSHDLTVRRGTRPWSLRLTDFPSEAERPSLPVTPAPVRRSSYWGGGALGQGPGGEANQPLPAADGVPAQTEWDPAHQLQKLAKQQSEAILRKLASHGERGSAGAPGREIPLRLLPFGSVLPASSAARSATPKPAVWSRPAQTDMAALGSSPGARAAGTAFSRAKEPAPPGHDQGIPRPHQTG